MKGTIIELQQLHQKDNDKIKQILEISWHLKYLEEEVNLLKQKGNISQ